MKAVILNAGRGSRLSLYTNDIHKSLITVANKKIIDYQLEALRYAGINEVVMVVGYLKEQIKDYLTKYDDFTFTFIDNPNYATTNTAFSLRLAKGELYGDTIYMNGDVVFDKRLVKKLIDSSYENALSVEMKKCDLEDVRVSLNRDKITRIGKDIPIQLSHGEFIGVAKFSKNIGELFIGALDDIIEKEQLYTVFFEEALQRIVDKVTLNAVDTVEHQTIEIDDLDDYDRAQKMFKKNNIKEGLVVKL